MQLNIYCAFAIFTVIDGTDRFVESPRNVAVIAADNVTLRCVFHRIDFRPLWDGDNNNTKMIWYVSKSNTLLVASSHAAVPYFPRHSVVGYPDRFDLFIRSAQSEDAGRYDCSDLPTTKTVSAELIILG